MITFLRQSILRPKDRISVGLQYLAGFFLTTFLGYVEMRAHNSEVLMRHLKFIVDNQKMFAVTFSVILLVWHYKFQVESRKEIKCRIVVGDRLRLIRLRYTIECAAILTLCAVVAITLAVQMSIPAGNIALLVTIFSFYVVASACLLESQ